MLWAVSGTEIDSRLPPIPRSASVSDSMTAPQKIPRTAPGVPGPNEDTAT